MKKTAPKGIATLVRKTTLGAVLTLNPGLSYDPNTKGMPHRNVFVGEITVQDAKTHTGAKHLIFTDHHGDSPNYRYIYRMEPGDLSQLKRVLGKMGYSLIDQAVADLQALRQRAAAKLTPEERAAVGLPVSDTPATEGDFNLGDKVLLSDGRTKGTVIDKLPSGMLTVQPIKTAKQKNQKIALATITVESSEVVLWRGK